MSLKITSETTFLLDMVNPTYGPVMNVTNCENSGTVPYTSFANGTPTGFDVTSDGLSTQKAGTDDSLSIVLGERYFVEFDAILNSGTAPSYFIAPDLDGGSVWNTEGVQTASSGANAVTLTANVSGTGVIQFTNISTTTDYEITNLSVRIIL